MSDESKFDLFLDPLPRTDGRVVQAPKKRGEASLPEPVVAGDLVYSQPYGDVPDELLSPAMEQEIRDHFGYKASETRTRAERNAAAARIVRRTQGQTGWAKQVWAEQAAQVERRERQLVDVRALRLIAKGK